MTQSATAPMEQNPNHYRGIKYSTYGLISMLRLPIKFLDVEVVLAVEFNVKKWALASISFFEVNVAKPPRRKLDDIRFSLRVGPLAAALIFAHYRGPDQKYSI